MGYSRPRALHLVIVILWIACANGCQADEFNCAAELSNIRMVATAVDDEMLVDAEVKMWVDHRSGVELPMSLCSEGDTLEINGKSAERVHAGDHPIYRQSLAPAAKYRFVLYRAGEGVTVEAVVESPPDFEIAEREDSYEISRASPVQVDWSSAPGDARIDVVVDRDQLDCLQRFEGEVADTGTATFPAPWPALAVDAPETSQCAAELVLTRRAVGAYPGKLRRGGAVDAFVKRRMRFTSVP